MVNQIIETRIDDHGVGFIEMQREDMRNALNSQLINALYSEIANLSKNTKISAIVLSGNGDAFCAGVDISWMEHMSGGGPSEDARQLITLLQSIKTSPKPTICKIHGACIGGGAALAAVSDIVIAGKNSFFAFPAVHLGAAPSVIAPFVAPVISARMAQRYMITGEKFDTSKALHMNLIHEICDEDQLNFRIGQILGDLLKGHPQTIADTKTIINQYGHRQGHLTDQECEAIAQLTGSLRRTDEAREGLAAFIEKRVPNWLK